MLKLIPIPAFADNYIWMLHDGKRALVVDPGDAGPVSRFLEDHDLQLESILVTHHHADHTGGVDALRDATGAKVYGPATERIPSPYLALKENDVLNVMSLDFQVLDVPGHTAGHIAFYSSPALFSAWPFDAARDDMPEQGAALDQTSTSSGASPQMNPRPLLFCGDTLFSGGSGRLFEGTAAQMLNSLDKLAGLPGNTCVCCAHEYTLGNLRFALAVEPNNAELMAYHAQCVKLRQRDQPTLPTSIARELLINPFLRTRQATVSTAARYFDAAAHDDISVFAAIRQWKNQFK
jgi:hydroxyacylglutathione hydrolase